MTKDAFVRVEDAVDEIRAVIDGAADIGVLAHKDADADSLGSALAFALALRDSGHRVHAMVPAPVPTLLTHLPGFSTLSSPPGHLDALFTFDCASRERFGDKRDLVETVRPLVNVDHHTSNEAFGTVNLVEADASATAQVVHRLLCALGLPIGADAATNLYAGLLTDTGGFRHENTDEAALRLGAELVRLGADPAFIALKSYKSRSFRQMRLEGLAIAAMTAELDGRLIWSQVTRAMLEEAGADMQESEGVIDQLQSIDTMQLAVLMKETSATTTKISVRTREPLDATRIAAAFNGGGHRRAAGADIPLPIAEATERVLVVAREALSGAA